jgi:hypothetical protein
MKEIIDGQDDEEGGKIESISKKKAEDLIEIIRSGMQRSKKVHSYTTSLIREESSDRNLISSIADELAKLGKLKDQGVISEEEFVQMKNNLIKKM